MLIPPLNTHSKLRLSTKRPDPEIYSGKDGLIKFEDWITDMEAKLLVNQDHFIDIPHLDPKYRKCDYIQSRMEGSKKTRAQTWMKHNQPATAHSLIDFLKRTN